MNKIQVLSFREDNDYKPNHNVIDLFQESPRHPALHWVFDCSKDSFGECPVNPSELNVTVLPTYIFMVEMSNGKWAEIARLSGSQTKETLKAKLEEVAHMDKPVPGSGADGSGIIPGDKPGGALLSLGIFNFPFSGPAWIWLIIAGLSGMKALSSRKKAGKIAFGSVAAVGLANYLNAKNKS